MGRSLDGTEIDLTATADMLSRAIELDDLRWLREHTRWVARAHEWDVGGRSELSVLRSGDIARVQAWMSRQGRAKSSIPPVSGTFIEASLLREQKDRRRTRRMTALASVLLLVAGFAVAAGAVSVVRLTSGAAARTSRTLTTLAVQAFESQDFEKSARYAIAAMNAMSMASSQLRYLMPAWNFETSRQTRCLSVLS